MSGGMKGNGFELWRRLFHEFKGTGQMTKNIGRRRFITFGRCNDLSKLSQHIDEWQNLLDEFAPDMLQCPETLRSMVDEIIPESIESELINHDEVVTWKDVVAFCKRRTYHLKQKTLAKSSKGKVNALAPLSSAAAADQPVPDDDDLSPPAWAKTIIAALSAPPAPHASSRASRGDRGRTTDKKRSDSKGSRGSSRDSSRGSSLARLKKKFIFRGGCNHCGVEGHQRKDCAEFLAIKAKHNGQLPSGYKGAREKAFDKWFAESKAGKSGDVAKPKPKAKPKAQHVRALAMQAESSDSDFTDDEQCPHIVTALSRCNEWEPVSRGTPLVKAYRSPYLRTQPLVNDNYWKKLLATRDTKHVVPPKITCEKDLDSLLDEHPMICSLPKDESKRVDLAKLAPKDSRYVYIMMDSGASLHAAHMETHFPDHILHLTEESERGDFACTANGDKLYNLGRFDVTGKCNGVKVVLGFTNMKVDVPVASVRTFVKNGNEVEFFDGGGVVRNKANGAQLPFIEMGGVYFLQLKVKPPKTSSQASVAGSPLFGGQGP